MTRDNRQILINPHSSQEKVPAGALNLGEIGVQHNNVEDAALYVETVADSQSAGTVAKFITDKAIDSKIEDAIDVIQMEIDGINEAVGLPHEDSGATPWGSGSSVWNAIEVTYHEMTAGTAAASTKVRSGQTVDTSKYLIFGEEVNQESSSVTYTIGLKNIDTAINSAYTIVNEKIESLSGIVESFSSATVEKFESVEEKLVELSAATQEVIGDLNYTGVTQEGKPVINVTQTDGLVAAETGEIDAHYVTVGTGETPLDEVIEEIVEKIDANEVSSEDGSVVVTPTADGTDLSVNIDNATIVQNDNNELVADLKLSAVTPSSVNVKEEFALIDHNGRQLGDTVKVYKDSSLYDAFLGHIDDVLSDNEDPESLVSGSGDTALDLIYHKEDGTYELVPINVNDFLEESEFQDGLEVDNHVVKIKIDGNSEEVVIGSGVTAPVLSVDEDGIKVNNIQNAIDYAVADLAGNINADVTGASQDGHVTVEVVQENTELTQVVVTTDDIASADELDTVEESVGLEEDGSFIPDPNGYYTASATSVRNEIQLIDQALKDVSDKLESAEVVEGSSTDNWVSLIVEPVAGQDGVTAITLDDSALAEELIRLSGAIETEKAEREAADAEIIGTSASTSADTTLMGIKKLIEELTTTLVKDVTVASGETLIDVDKQDTPEGDLYTISSTQKLNDAVELAEKSVQDVEFAALPDEDRTYAHPESGVAGKVEDNTLTLDMSYLRVDCGEY